jgi:hypothetical protein
MDDAVCMNVFEAQANVAKHSSRLLLPKSPVRLPPQVSIQLPALTKLHHQVNRLGILKVVQQSEDVWVSQLAVQADFILDAALHVGCPDEQLVDDFDGHFEGGTGGRRRLKHLSKGALSNLSS